MVSQDDGQRLIKSEPHSNTGNTAKKIRGPFAIEELEEITGASVGEIRTYRQQGLIPRRRAWAQGPAMFYKS